MSKSTLAVLLSQLKSFSTPNTTLEQYQTPSEIAAEILWDAQLQGLIKGKKVIDLCAGNGIFGIGALLLGAEHVEFIDIDPVCEELIAKNIEHFTKEFEISGSTQFQALDATQELSTSADVLFTNPPFGTKQTHVDKEILAQAIKITNHIYSFHKTSTKEYIVEFMQQRGFLISNTFRTPFSLKATMPQHKKKQHPVDITCWHFSSTKDL